jgi:hypothetical protein
MTLENIGVFVDATPDGEKRIDYAAAPRRICGSPGVSIRLLAIGEKAIRAALAARKAADEAATSDVRRRFEAIREARSPYRIPGEPSRWT